MRPIDERGKIKDENGRTIKILTHTIPDYFTEANIFYIDFYIRYKRLGNPWDIGWAKWPFWAIDVIDALDSAMGMINGS